MKTLKIGGLKLKNGVFIKPYTINVYDGDLHEMPEKPRFEFETQLYAAAHVPTTIEGVINLHSRLESAVSNPKTDPKEAVNIVRNFSSGLLQRIHNFTCEDHAFYCLIEGVTNFTTEHAKKKIKMLREHGLNKYITDSICEDVKKKYIPNYAETTQAYTKAQLLIDDSMP